MKRLLTAALAALLMGCTAPDEINESNLYGCWKAKVWENIYDMYLNVQADHTYKIMIASHGECYSGSWIYPHYYYEGTWQTDGNDLLLLHGDTVVYTLYDVDARKKKISFDLYDGYENDGIEYCEGLRYAQLNQSIVIGTWSFTEREVISSVYDLVLTLDETYNARLTYSGPNGHGGHSIYDYRGIGYDIVGPYIVFTGANPMYHFIYRSKQIDGSIKFESGNNWRRIGEFYAIPQDPSAHTLRLDGFIF